MVENDQQQWCFLITELSLLCFGVRPWCAPLVRAPGRTSAQAPVAIAARCLEIILISWFIRHRFGCKLRHDVILNKGFHSNVYFRR